MSVQLAVARMGLPGSAVRAYYEYRPIILLTLSQLCRGVMGTVVARSAAGRRDALCGEFERAVVAMLDAGVPYDSLQVLAVTRCLSNSPVVGLLSFQ